MVIITLEEAKQLSESVLVKAGIDKIEAGIITHVLLEAEMIGRPTHGFIRLPGIIGGAKDQAGKKTKLICEAGNNALIDGGGKYGYVVAYDAMELAINKATEHGLALVGVKNSGHSGVLGYYARMALKKDFIGIVICNTRPMVAPYSGIDPVFGTNPIAIAIPSEGLSLALDMSTSSVTFGDILVATQMGKRLPEGVALDPDGQPTTDPHKAKNGVFLPFGGYKGFGLGLVIQIMAGALVDSDILKTGGILLMAIDPGIFLPIDDFKKRVAEYLNFVKKSRKMPGVSEILIPGERSERQRQECIKNGIMLDEELLQQLRK
jgi:L-2-hydroxycarboxylate dehydrogenase (NAD+)